MYKIHAVKPGTRPGESLMIVYMVAEGPYGARVGKIKEGIKRVACLGSDFWSYYKLQEYRNCVSIDRFLAVEGKKLLSSGYALSCPLE